MYLTLHGPYLTCTLLYMYLTLHGPYFTCTLLYMDLTLHGPYFTWTLLQVISDDGQLFEEKTDKAHGKRDNDI